MVSQQSLKLLLHYNPDTGHFTWNKRRGLTGRKAGCIKQSHGYVAIMIDGKHYLAHRLAFIYMTSSCPKQIDHKSREKTDNRWTNLRSATPYQNAANSVGDHNKASGLPKGVFANGARYQSQIRAHGIKRYLGTFPTIKAAKQAYDDAALSYFGEYARS